MPDINIPGVSNSNSRINTRELIDDLVAAERIPLDRIESDVDRYQFEQNVWRELSRSVETLRTEARRLYSFESPFRSRIANSSQPSAVSATASRQADRLSSRLAVESIATRDHFASDPLPQDYTVPAGTYRFTVGDSVADLEFDGGSLNEFADRINSLGNQQAERFVVSRVINNSSSTAILSIAANETGSNNRLGFGGAAYNLAIEIGMIAPRPLAEHTLNFDTASVSNARVDGATVILQPSSNAIIPASPPLDQISDTMRLEFEAAILDSAPEISTAMGPEISSSGSITLEDITITNDPSEHLLPDPESLRENITIDSNMLFVKSGDNVIPLTPLSGTDEFETISIALRDFVDSFDELRIVNNNSHRTVHIRNIAFNDGISSGDFTPRNPIEVAKDAQFTIDGVSATRSSNTIDDLIPGVTLTLRRPTSEAVDLTIDPDYEAITEQVIRFIGNYNLLINDIDLLTRNDDALIEELGYLDTDERRAEATERLGLLSGDSSLRRLKSSLQNVMMNPYSTSGGQGLALLAQVGIATNLSGGGADRFDPANLRGRLSMDDATFRQQLLYDLESVAQLFGNDTDGDLIIDSGVAFEVERQTSVYSQAGGIISTRDQSLDTRIDNSQKRIETYSNRLDRYEQGLTEDFGRMESALNSLDDASRSLQGLNNNNN